MTGWQVFWATLILAWAIIGALLAVANVYAEGRHEALLDALWADDDGEAETA